MIQIVFLICFTGRLFSAVSRPEIAHDVEEDGCGKANRIDPVHHAAVAFDHVAPVFHTKVAFDGRHHQAACKTHQANHQAD